MGHLAPKNIYTQLGDKLDSLTTRVPVNEDFLGILKELYTPEEACLIVKMPTCLVTLENLAKIREQGKAN